MKILLLLLIISLGYILFQFLEDIIDFIIPIGIVLVVIGGIGYVLYSSIAAKWIAAEGIVDYALIVGQAALILSTIGFLIWAIFTETGRAFLKIAMIVVGVIGAVCILGYVFVNFGGIYGIIAICILIFGGFFFFIKDDGYNGKSLIYGHKEESFGGKPCATCIHHKTHLCPFEGRTKDLGTCSEYRNFSS